MFKKASLKSCEIWRKGKYMLYENNKFCIVKQYNFSGKKNYLKDLKDCFWMLVYGIISIIGFPFALLITLWSFIPSIYIKDNKVNENM